MINLISQATCLETRADTIVAVIMFAALIIIATHVLTRDAGDGK
jgi:hypothetical protein